MQSSTVGGLFSGLCTVSLLLLLSARFTPTHAQTANDWGNQRYDAEGKDGVGTIITYASVGDGAVTIRKMEINYGGSGREAIFLIHRKAGNTFVVSNEESILFIEKSQGNIVSLIFADPGSDGKNLAEATRYRLTRYDLSQPIPGKKSLMTDNNFPRWRMSGIISADYEGIKRELLKKFKLKTVERVEFTESPPAN